MTHETFKELMRLAVLDEIGEDARRSLEGHLADCSECRAEFRELESLFSLVGENRGAEPTDEMLWEARRDLRAALAEEPAPGVRPAESNKKRLTQGMAWSGLGSAVSPASGVSNWIRGFRMAFAGAAAVAAGVLIGYLVFGRVSPTMVEPAPVELAGPADAIGGPDYRNVRFVNIDPRNGEVEFEYDVVRPARFKAGINDERVQRMLANVVTSNGNPGARLEAINTIGAFVEEPRDERIKQALVQAARSDPNPGVRKHALYVLYQMPFDNDIKEACLHVLGNDNNAGLRIAAINILAAATLDGHLENKDLSDAVGQDLARDENGFIRAQYGAFLQEVNGNGE
jgi:hypothetical protein